MSGILPDAKFVATMLFAYAAPFLIIGLVTIAAYSCGMRDGKLNCECQSKGGHLVKGECVRKVE